ncbi:anthranilate synthase component I [Metabacillus idriensis]|uniref:Anthranilate synthase component 1 n=1 Tax=Metabacillus idriensis TaxID=324768 RepID=A0A6I2MIQ3_9BACI|nr:anthranilate synthase component I [Metabacillus idriensis]MCM3596950.1 anthranilate synthase component I [Metabacillus idriensis]MRX55703.1 anthranilate synthase component I [Metabacillus idriensis]OHR74588.1 anthranilate synthase [Bacillus sp. HMSC76G11]
MFHTDFASFKQDSMSYQTIPVIKSFQVDTFTPIQLFKVFEDEAVYLLESKDAESSWSRYSFIGLNPFLFIEEENDRYCVRSKQRKTIYESSSLKEIFQWMDGYLKVKLPDLDIPFAGGAVGYLGYDSVTMFERVPKHANQDLNFKKCLLFVCHTMIAFDHIDKTLSFIHYERLSGKESEGGKRAVYDIAETKINQLISQLTEKRDFNDLMLSPMDQASVSFEGVTSNFEKDDFLDSVEKIKEYIRAGDIFQGVLSQRFEMPITAKGFDLYRMLRVVNPSPYMFYIKFDETELIGSSPERLIYVQDGYLEIHPIAGTRKRGKTEEEDLRMAEDLRSDEKEKAEHYMLVDLARNDIGRVADYGTVKTPVLMELGRFSHVMHLISKVTGQLKTGIHPIDALLSSFPAGTVSGAPKVRAMQILQELEPTARNAYAGCIAYIGFDGNIDSCITIRTISLQGGKAYVQAGAGIVADSKPELEWKETRNKASALIKTIELAEKVFGKKEEAENENITQQMH